MSTISPSSYHAVWSRPQETRNTAAASAAATSVNRRDAGTGREDGEGDEGEEPGDVEVEPVRQHELERDQDGGGERGELQDRLSPRHESDQHAPRDDEHLEHLLDGVEVRHARGVVLPPTPDREGRVAVELEPEGALREDAGSVQRVGLEQKHEKGRERRAREREREP